MTALLARLRTYRALGVANVLAVAGYRLALRAGLHPVQRIRADSPAGDFFAGPVARDEAGIAAARALDLFGWHRVHLSGAPPQWNANVVTGLAPAENGRPWFAYDDFDPALGDIKLVWELSRFTWVPVLAQAARQGDGDALVTLNAWLSDWLKHNPPYLGRQWKCGQEASFRVINLWLAADILGTETPALRAFIALHLRRIAPTMAYARAQDNNHGTSEAAALFVGGLALGPEGAGYVRQGRQALEERVRALFNGAGGFSQYSMVYHRLALDTLGLAEVARRRHGAAAFSSGLQQRMAAAADWLYDRMAVSGDAPNFGANDGANLLGFTGSTFRDFRPSAALALALWRQRILPGKPVILDWLGIAPPPEEVRAPRSSHDAEGGTLVLRRGEALAFLHYPRFRFRPGQADLLHLDFWLGGMNLLRDGGSYSYNTDAETYDYFSGMAGHNTVQFDGRQPMPRLGRFLFADWPQGEFTEGVMAEGEAEGFAVAYEDAQGARHDRAVRLEPQRLSVHDAVRGFVREAVVRWRLAPADWRLEREGQEVVLEAQVAGRRIRLTVTASAGLSSVRLTEGWESRHYMEKTALPVLAIGLSGPGRVGTVMEWAA